MTAPLLLDGGCGGGGGGGILRIGRPIRPLLSTLLRDQVSTVGGTFLILTVPVVFDALEMPIGGTTI